MYILCCILQCIMFEKCEIKKRFICDSDGTQNKLNDGKKWQTRKRAITSLTTEIPRFFWKTQCKKYKIKPTFRKLPYLSGTTAILRHTLSSVSYIYIYVMLPFPLRIENVGRAAFWIKQLSLYYLKWVISFWKGQKRKEERESEGERE